MSGRQGDGSPVLSRKNPQRTIEPSPCPDGADGMTPHHAAIITDIRDGDIFFNAHSSSKNDKPLSEYVLGTEKGEMIVIVKIKDDA